MSPTEPDWRGSTSLAPEPHRADPLPCFHELSSYGTAEHLRTAFVGPWRVNVMVRTAPSSHDARSVFAIGPSTSILSYPPRFVHRAPEHEHENCEALDEFIQCAESTLQNTPTILDLGDELSSCVEGAIRSDISSCFSFHFSFFFPILFFSPSLFSLSFSFSFFFLSRKLAAGAGSKNCWKGARAYEWTRDRRCDEK